jgi:hypothetical protein
MENGELFRETIEEQLLDFFDLCGEAGVDREARQSFRESREERPAVHGEGCSCSC